MHTDLVRGWDNTRIHKYLTITNKIYNAKINKIFGTIMLYRREKKNLIKIMSMAEINLIFRPRSGLLKNY